MQEVKCNKTQFTLIASFYTFRLQGAIFRECNNNKGSLSRARTVGAIRLHSLVKIENKLPSNVKILAIWTYVCQHK